LGAGDFQGSALKSHLDTYDAARRIETKVQIERYPYFSQMRQAALV
jgi:hypothetical protein